MATDVLRTAKAHRFVKEYKRFCEMQVPIPGMSYYDRIRVAEKMISDGLIEIKDDRFFLANQPILPPWLKEEIISGEENGLQLLELLQDFFPSNKKFDSERLSEIGLQGETFLYNFLCDRMPEEKLKHVIHISLFDDTAGFDIKTPDPANLEISLLLEVKTTVRPGKTFQFYLSRNEYNIAKVQNNWKLVAILKRNGRHDICGFVNRQYIFDNAPVDISNQAMWQNAKFEIPFEDIEQNIWV